MKASFFLLIVICFFVSLKTKSQTKLASILTQLNVSVPLKKEFGLNIKLESLQSFYNPYQKTEGSFNYFYERTDLQTFLTKKITPLKQVAFGYQFRVVSNGTLVNRFLQQYAIVQQFGWFRGNHRFRIDQTFGPAISTFRFRYRFAAEIPLSGQTINKGEYYLLAMVEPLLINASKNWILENRFCGYIGHHISEKHKIEVGLDYRLDQFTSTFLRQRYWCRIAWFVKI